MHVGAKLFATTVLVLGLSTLALPATAQSRRDRLKASHPAPSAAIPTVSEPTVGSGPDKMFANYPLSKVGYSASEFFFSGTAHAYTSASPLDSSGKWTVQPASSAPYTSRLIVVMPTDPKKFNGTVVVELLNVAPGFDIAGDWVYGHDEMIRSGDAYVGVSAQAVGVNAAKTADPARYGSLSHPGDSFSYDIYSQAGMAVREHASTVLPGLKPRLFLADGLSESANYMTTYVDAIAPLVNVFDGYLMHSRFAGERITVPASRAGHRDTTNLVRARRPDRAGPDPRIGDRRARVGVPSGGPTRQQDVPPVGSRRGRTRRQLLCAERARRRHHTGR